MSDRFHFYLRVRYGECDAQKIVFNSRYSDYADIAGLEFLRAAGLGEAVTTGGLDYQVVKQTMEWKSSARFDQVLDISVRANHLGNTSFSLLVEVRIAATEPVIATVETVYVLVVAHTLEKLALPREFRAALERGAPGKTVDHAGYLSAPSA
ncbi:MAG TPA: thioesterase family protein [Candidatus Acidoferrales bacterium]|nr:thioesterase family protein [Candidatus Acidoferrales bacterium]